VASAQDEASTAGRVKAESTPLLAVRRPTFRRARKMGHPRFLFCQH
jgi:hypothetical protein